jgi:mono/diheme cytochrome c family protein
MTTNEIILAVACACLVVFSLVVAIVVPKRNPDFPARRMGAFFAVSVALVAGMLAIVEVFGEEGEEAGAAEVAETQPAAGETTPPAETGGAETGGAETGGAETGGAETGGAETGGAETGGGEATAGDPAAGSEIFASAGCGGCHTLADAGTSGTVGPNLDDSQPPLELVVDRVTNGQGVMPAFAGQLSDAEIRDVAAYVVQATSG